MEQRPRTVRSKSNHKNLNWGVRRRPQLLQPLRKRCPTPFLPNSFKKRCPTPRKGLGVRRGYNPPPQIFVWCQIEAIRHHNPLHEDFVWCQIEAIRHHIPLLKISLWCRIAPIWHHKFPGIKFVVPNSRYQSYKQGKVKCNFGYDMVQGEGWTLSAF